MAKKNQTTKTDGFNAAGIAAHNDGVLAWLKSLCDIAMEGGNGKFARYPNLYRAFQAFWETPGVTGLVAQTGFLPSGSNAGAKEGETSKPFDYLPHVQGGGVVYAMSNPRVSDQDLTLTVSILSAIANTVDPTSTHDWEGNEVRGGGYSNRKADAKPDDAFPRVKSNNKTLNSLLEELSITRDKAVYSMAPAMRESLRAAVPAFPAEARSLPVPVSRPSGVLNIPLTVQTTSSKDGTPLSYTLTIRSSNDPKEVLAFLLTLRPTGVKVGEITVGREEIVAMYGPLYQSHEFTLKITEPKSAKSAEPVAEIIEAVA